jgi:hypothetical protein
VQKQQTIRKAQVKSQKFPLGLNQSIEISRQKWQLSITVATRKRKKNKR